MYQHHCFWSNATVRFLFTDRPLCRFSGQMVLVGVHEPPRPVEEMSDHINWAVIKTLARNPLRHIKSIFGHISVAFLAPSPVLYPIVIQMYGNKFK